MEADGLANKMGQLKLQYMMAVTWHTIFERFNTTSLTIQGIEIDLLTIVKLFRSLLSFTIAIWDDSFDDLDERAKLFVEIQRTRKLEHDEKGESNFSAKAALQKPNWNHEINSKSKVSILSWIVSQLSYAEDSQHIL